MSCCAVSCANRYKKASGLGFFRFPSDLQRRKAWVKAVSRAKWCPSTHDRLCGDPTCNFLPFLPTTPRVSARRVIDYVISRRVYTYGLPVRWRSDWEHRKYNVRLARETSIAAAVSLSPLAFKLEFQPIRWSLQPLGRLQLQQSNRCATVCVPTVCKPNPKVGGACGTNRVVMCHAQTWLGTRLCTTVVTEWNLCILGMRFFSTVKFFKFPGGSRGHS